MFDGRKHEVFQKIQREIKMRKMEIMFDSKGEKHHVLNNRKNKSTRVDHKEFHCFKEAVLYYN